MVQGFIVAGQRIKFEAEYDAGGSRALLSAEFDSLNEGDKQFITSPQFNMFGSFGCGGEDQGTSLLMLMIQHELIGFIEHMMKGFEITDEKIGAALRTLLDADGLKITVVRSRDEIVVHLVDHTIVIS